MPAGRSVEAGARAGGGGIMRARRMPHGARRHVIVRAPCATRKESEVLRCAERSAGGAGGRVGT